MKDYRVTVSVRNNRLISLIEERFGTQSNLARAIGIGPSQVSKFVTMSEPPVTQSGWSESALQISAALGVYPSDIWPEHMQEVRLKTRTADLHLSSEEVLRLVNGGGNAADLREVIEISSSGLTPRESDFLEWILSGNGNETLKEKGGFLGVSTERARQIEKKMFRKMKRKLCALGANQLSDVMGGEVYE